MLSASMARLPAGGAARLPALRARPLAAARRLPARRASPVCLAGQRGAVELMLDRMPGEGEVLSAKLNPDVRQRAERGACAPAGRLRRLLRCTPTSIVLRQLHAPPAASRLLLAAIKARGGRVTVGDVASTAGLRLDEAEGAVRALAADSQATLQVRGR